MKKMRKETAGTAPPLVGLGSIQSYRKSNNVCFDLAFGAPFGDIFSVLVHG